MRKLATIRSIDNLTPINGADRIETAWFGGWTVVVQKGLYSVGDKVVYLEVDSCLPIDNPIFASLAERGTKKIEDKLYHRLKTIRLKKQISQGFALPIRESGLSEADINDEECDLSEKLGIIKWDPELYAPGSAQLAGNALRPFPSSIVPKTDEERCQNLPWVVNLEDSYEVTLKLDGSSFTAYYSSNDEHKFGVCSRNLQLKFDDPINEGNALVKIAIKLDLENKLANCGKNVAIQAEIVGMGIQGNKDKFTEHKLFVFNVWDIDNQEEFLPKDRREFVASIGLEHIPVLEEALVPKERFTNIQQMLEYADGPSINAKWREGVVFKCNSRVPGSKEVLSFKAISNQFLLQNGDD